MNPSFDSYILMHIISHDDGWEVREFPDVFQPAATGGKMHMQDGYQRITLIQCPVRGMSWLTPEWYHYQWNGTDYDFMGREERYSTVYCNDE